jgi:YbbR domain-containing protein
VINLTPETVGVSLPTGVKLDEIQPSRIAIRIEAVEEKEIAVKAETYGEIPEGYEIYSETITPTKIRVRGRRILSDADVGSTERIDLSNRTSDFTVKQIP